MAGPQTAPGYRGAGPQHDWIWGLLQKAGLVEHLPSTAMVGDPYASAAAASARRAGLADRRPTSAAVVPAPAGSRIMNAFGGAPQMTPSEEANLRRQQAIQAREEEKADIWNSPYAFAALAPVATVLGLEAGGGFIGDLANPVWPRGPLSFPWREPPLAGETRYTQLGKYVHALWKAAAQQKVGWGADETLVMPGGRIRPDFITPLRGAAGDTRQFLIELKPNTPSGRRAAARAVKRYFELTGKKTRAIFYDPKDYE